MSSAPSAGKSPSVRATRFLGITSATFLAASSAPTPLYRIYQERFATSPILMAVVFAVYALTLLAALVVLGSLSDHLGRKPVILAALIGEMAAMMLFLDARGPDWLIAARAAQGLATGIAIASLGAALIDVDRATGSLVNAVAPFAGMTAGVLGASALVQYAPLPLRSCFALLLSMFVGQALALWRYVPETARIRGSARPSLRPRVGVPPRIRRPFALITAINVANWTLGGFYLSLVPALVVAVTGNRAPLVGGSVVGALMLSGTAAILTLRARTPLANLGFGVSTATLGIAAVVAGVHLSSVPVLGLGTFITGMGFGANYLGCVGAILPLAGPDERAALLSAFYVQSYLAFSVPAIIAGILVNAIGYAATADVFGIAIAAASLGGLVFLRSADRGTIAT